MSDNPTFHRIGLSFLMLLLCRPVLSGTAGIVEIEVEDRPQPTAATTLVPKEQSPSAQPSTVILSLSNVSPVSIVTPVVVQGVFKMKDLYQSGVRAYQEKDYEKAIRYFKAALEIHDPYSSKFYYAETHGLLGVIYQFFYPVPNHLGLAREEYLAALKIDPQTKSARKHLAEVSGKGR